MTIGQVSMDEYRSARMAMIDSQLRSSGVMDRGILAAMSEVPREMFVADHRRPVAYVDDIQPLPHGRFMLSPSQFARMAQLGRIAPTERVLDIGVATGYSSAILSRLSREVCAVEHVGELADVARAKLSELAADNVTVLDGDHRAAAGTGLFDVIVVEGAVEAKPADLLELLAEDGRLVVPQLRHGVAVVGTYTRGEGGVMFASAFDATIPRLRNDILDDEFRF